LVAAAAASVAAAAAASVAAAAAASVVAALAMVAAVAVLMVVLAVLAYRCTMLLVLVLVLVLLVLLVVRGARLPSGYNQRNAQSRRRGGWTGCGLQLPLVMLCRYTMLVLVLLLWWSTWEAGAYTEGLHSSTFRLNVIMSAFCEKGSIFRGCSGGV